MVFMTAELPLTNTPEFSVSDISNALKKTVEGAFSHVRVRGELSRVTIAKSGHLYSDLKDDKAVLNIVCWKGTVQKLPIHP
jgi:exodeoxyribonuclease VII large subunit